MVKLKMVGKEKVIEFQAFVNQFRIYVRCVIRNIARSRINTFGVRIENSFTKHPLWRIEAFESGKLASTAYRMARSVQIFEQLLSIEAVCME